MKALILAGGFGSRLKQISGDLPKPMVSVAGRPLLEHQIDYLKKQGIEDVVLATHYGAHQIKNHFGRGGPFGVNIDYSYEDSPLGTAGAIYNAKRFFSGGEPFLVLNGDSFTDLNLTNFQNFGRELKTHAIALTRMGGEESKHYGVVKVDSATNLIKRFEEKTKEGSPVLINAGVYFFNEDIFRAIPSNKPCSLEKEIFPELVRKKRLAGYPYEGYFIDVGRPETYTKFSQDLLRKLCVVPGSTIREAYKIMHERKSPIAVVCEGDMKLKGIITEVKVAEHIASGGDLDVPIKNIMITRPKYIISDSSTDKERTALLEKTRRLPVLDKEGRLVNLLFRSDRAEESSRILGVQGISPLRLSFAGGGSDIPDFYESHGGSVVSTSIAQYCRASATKRPDRMVFINLPDYQKSFSLDDLENTGKTSVDIFKAVLRLTNPNFGIKFNVTNDIPPGRGLGSSASFCSLLTQMVGNLAGKPYSREECAELSFRAETEGLGIIGGKQDQYAATFGGFNWIEFSPNGKGINIYPLRFDGERADKLHSHLTLFYTGKGHKSQEQHKAQEEKRKENGGETTQRLRKMADYSKEWRDCLVSARPSFGRMGEILDECWKIKKSLSQIISDQKIDRLYAAGINSGAWGGKLLGSGGGGYLLFMHSPERRNEILRSISHLGAQYTPFNFEKKGTTVWINE